MIDIKVPTVGESITEVTLIKWLKKDGEYVERDAVIAELESEKATFEVNALQSGILKTKATEGDTINIGDILASIDETAPKPAVADTASVAPVPKPVENIPASTVPTATAAGKGVIEVKVPTVGESITEVSLIKWVKKDGELVRRDDVIAELESEKATFELNAEESGKLTTKAKEGDTLKIGDVIAAIDSNVVVATNESVKAVESKPVALSSQAQLASTPNDVKASPVACSTSSFIIFP